MILLISNHISSLKVINETKKHQFELWNEGFQSFI